MKFPTKKEFEAQFARRLSLASTLVAEAIGARPEWREVVVHREHGDLLVRVLLSHRPSLVGEIAAHVENDGVGAALAVATQALAELFTADPYLIWSSKITREEAAAWMRRHYVGRDRAEIDGITDRAGPNSIELWAYRYAAAHTLAESGEDPVETWRTITSAQRAKAAKALNGEAVS